MVQTRVAGALVLLIAGAALPARAAPPAIPDIDAPERAAPGAYPAGVRHLVLDVPARLDPLASLAAGRRVDAPRHLGVRLWYPAARGCRTAVTYHASVVGERGTPRAAFSVPGIACAAAPAAKGAFPVVLISHGYGNDPVMQSWLAENLATKGYVVVAPEHRDPPNWDRPKVPAGLLSRPLDITDALARLRAGWLGAMADTSRIALIGYSYGGYGVLATAGAALDARSPALGSLPAPLVADYAAGGPRAAQLTDTAIRAVVAIAPAGGAPWSVWGTKGEGLAAIRAPLLVIAGSADRTVGYEAGPAAIFAQATGSDRHLLVFQGAGHDIGTIPPPAEVHRRLWDLDWFADPVWRKDRINAIATHFITAFLDQHLKNDSSAAAYLAVPSEMSDGAAWKGSDTPYAQRSAGGDNPTWKGFWRGHQDGLILRHLAPAKAP